MRGDLLVWVVFPYAALVVFAVGHVWRWRTDQFGWTTRSTQLLERRWLWWGSNLFHFGALLAIGGHVVGILIPKSFTETLGVPESTYHRASVAMGSLAGLMCLAGLVILILRRLRVPRVAATTTTADLVAYAAITVAIVTGVMATSGYQLLTGGYDYRVTVAPYFRGIFSLDPQPALMTSAPFLYQLHVLASFALYALWPFTRLVHVWSVPWRYLMRRPIVYRAARGAAPARPRRRL
jgi:nitrate reductase gamma subunit